MNVCMCISITRTSLEQFQPNLIYQLSKKEEVSCKNSKNHPHLPVSLRYLLIEQRRIIACYTKIRHFQDDLFCGMRQKNVFSFKGKVIQKLVSTGYSKFSSAY